MCGVGIKYRKRKELAEKGFIGEQSINIGDVKEGNPRVHNIYMYLMDLVKINLSNNYQIHGSNFFGQLALNFLALIAFGFLF